MSLILTIFMQLSAPPHPTRAVCSVYSTKCPWYPPCLSDADWCLRSHNVPDSRLQGVAIQARVVMSSVDTITAYREPSGFGIRVDSAGFVGYQPSPFFDLLLAKVGLSHACTDPLLHIIPVCPPPTHTHSHSHTHPYTFSHTPHTSPPTAAPHTRNLCHGTTQHGLQ